MRIKNSETGNELKRLYNKELYDEIGSIEGFTIIEKRNHEEDTKRKFGCVTWIFGGDKNKVKKFTSDSFSPPGYEEVEEPSKGDLVTYFRPATAKRHFANIYEIPARPTHTGIFVGNGRVQSKFRESHVYEHPLEAVPPEYGSEVRFFREIEER